VYRVLYRKYRPPTFADVWGQAHITEILRKQITTGRVAHAYLFTGSRGIGKTTCAKILAKAVNCLHPKDGDPCGECEVCRGIENESITEVVEMDAASNNGVGDVRDLQERLAFAPTQTKYRVYIIDEVHMMSDSAFNALLKTLEEPPQHVLFILATTEVQALPATILSRCQRMDFRRISAEDIAGRLEEIAAREGVIIEHDAALLIGRIADGGMRDAVSLLDQCLTRSQLVDEQVVRDAAGLAGHEHILELSQTIYRRDAAAAIIMLDRLYGMSMDMLHLGDELLSHYRSLMIINTVSKPEELIIATTEQLAELKEDAKNYPLSRIMGIIDTLQGTMERMGRGAQRRTEMELALMKLCRQADEDDKAVIAALEQRVKTLERAVREGIPAAETKPKQPEAPPVANDRLTQISDAAQPFDRWSEVIAALEKESNALFSMLNGSRAFVSDRYLLIETTDMAADLLNQSASKAIMHRILEETIGTDYRLAPYRPSAAAGSKEPSQADRLLERARSLGANISED